MLPSSNELFAIYIPGVLYEHLVFPNAYAITMRPFYDISDIPVLEVWQDVTKKQQENLDHVFVNADALNAQLQSSKAQALVGFLETKRAFCIEIERADFINEDFATHPPFTIVISVCINPYFENNPGALQMIVFACRDYIFSYEDINCILWTISKENPFLRKLAKQCGFKKTAIVVEPEFLSYSCSREDL